MLHIKENYSEHCVLTASKLEHMDKSIQKKEKLY